MDLILVQALDQILQVFAKSWRALLDELVYIKLFLVCEVGGKNDFDQFLRLIIKLKLVL